jgi:hypothetical protein
MRQGHSQERLFSNPPKIIAWICFQSSVRRFECAKVIRRSAFSVTLQNYCVDLFPIQRETIRMVFGADLPPRIL